MSIVEMRVPTIGESITEVTLSQWLVENGSYVAMDQPICEFESDKATLEFPAEAAGSIEYVAGEDEDLEIGALVARIDTSAQAPAELSVSEDKKAAPPESVSVEAPATADGPAAGHPSPAAAKKMREAGLSADQVPASGKGGRITKQDADRAAAAQSTAPISTVSDNGLATPQAFSRATRREKMSRMRRTIAGRLVRAKNNTAMLTTFNEVDLTAVQAFRKQYQDSFVKKYGIKLGYMSLFAKACAEVLMEMPQVNAHIDGNELIYHDYADISIAISTDNGLVVPPVHNVESLGYHEIELAIKALASKARDGSLTLEEMQGGTFTITNGGIFGSMMSTPILNEPQSAILGMHNIIQRPVAIDGQVVVRPMMYIALSYDHRVIDGSSSVTFLRRVKEYLEDPMRMLIQV